MKLIINLDTELLYSLTKRKLHKSSEKDILDLNTDLKEEDI